MNERSTTLKAKYIAIEGVIGAGKTTLARAIHRRFGGLLVLEQHEENPFLPDFYRDRERYAFQTQMFFLLSRWRQQQDLTQFDIFNEKIIADYLFAKDRIFAAINLNDKELDLYEKLYESIEKTVIKPDLVVYLQSPVQKLMYNIKLRARNYEKDITEEYITELAQAYNQFFYQYDSSNLIIVNCANLDFVKNNEQLEKLLNFIEQEHQGKVFFQI
ncbi:MAG: deoxynucleoside kinase [bacterium]|nr:deoxynucleoside kinase [bacterium]